MKIKIEPYNNHWRFDTKTNMLYYLKQKFFDYTFKYLDFDKLDKSWRISFNDCEIETWFRKTHINSDYLVHIYYYSPEGYEYLKNNWGKNIFSMNINYQYKQELKTIVNKVINTKLIRGS